MTGGDKMKEQQPKFHEWFHKFLIWFALWMMAAFAILNSLRYIMRHKENGYQGMELAMIVIVNGLTILVGLFIVKVRFDLAAFREKAPVELLGAFLSWAALNLINWWVTESIGNDEGDRSLIVSAFILACWGIAVYRYYHDRGYLFDQTGGNSPES